jgi:DNA-directed RNA polymerase subunit alpha
MNKDLIIMTATEQTDYEIEIFATRGRGYRTFQENKELANTFGLIPVD